MGCQHLLFVAFSKKRISDENMHKVHICRVPQCLSPRRNWDSPNPSRASECAQSHSPELKGGGALGAGEGLGES
jgi:hypothetical protein